METTNNSKKVSRGSAFAVFVLKRLAQDTAFGAALRRADNPATEYQSWEYLASWCDLDDTVKRTCYATVAAGLAHSKQNTAGAASLGATIAGCYRPDGNQDDSAKRKLRRLLACENSTEACQWIRPILRLAQSRGVNVDFGRLLDDLLYFGAKVKERWAMDFYGKKEAENDRLGA